MHIALLALLLNADDAKIYSVAEGSTVKYTLVHKAHTVVGVAKKDIDGKVKLQAGQAQLMVRIPIASFDSENSNRDAHMKEAVEAAKFPNVELKAVAQNVTPGSTTSAELTGKLTFHGVTNDIKIPVTIAWSDKGAKVVGKFDISLEGYKVERPSLLFVKVDDKLSLSFDMTIKE